MAEGIERFMGPISSSLQPEADGQWVRYSDYEKLEGETRRKEQIRESEVVEAHEHRALHEELRRRAERERDQATQAEHQRIREALLGEEAISKAFTAAQDVNWDVHRDRLRDRPEGRPTNRDVVRAAFVAALDSLGDGDGEIREARTFGEDGHDNGAVTAAEAFSGREPLKLAISEEEAKERGICPVCEGYGGGEDDDDHPCRQEDAECGGSCPQCWCPGCHDDWDLPESRLGELDDGGSSGSWLAYELIHGTDGPGER